MLDPDDRSVGKGSLCAEAHAFNLQAATRVVANDRPGGERLCRYILRPPLANDRLHLLPDGAGRLDFKKPEKPARKSKYIPWAELLRRTFAIDIKCAKCGSPLRLIALIKTRAVIEKILVAMHPPADIPELHPARPPPQAAPKGREAEDRSEDRLN